MQKYGDGKREACDDFEVGHGSSLNTGFIRILTGCHTNEGDQTRHLKQETKAW